MLRGLIPHSDQKRDKASFLLEVHLLLIPFIFSMLYFIVYNVLCKFFLQVVEYIQFLQEKVQKYEGSYQEWNHEMAKLVPLVITCF